MPDGGTFFYVLQDSLRILFVDDDPILREFAQVHLTTETAEVALAEDGVDALARLDSFKPDLVLLDLEMPRMDGFEALSRLRADPEHAHTPVIVVTGREDVEAIDKAFQAGATSFLVKPLNWRLLSYQIRYVNRTHQAELALMSARSQAQARAAQARQAIVDLRDAGSRFLGAALAADGALKPAAAAWLSVLETTAAAASDADDA